MHRHFRKLLEEATGVSEFIVAVNADIRGFSSFSKNVESPDAAMFVKRVYMTLVDNYFPNASFFKPTGDGLLITVPYTENDLEKVARATIDSCSKVLKDFGTFCTNDPMINFEVPRKIGIGISRGTACRIVSKGKTLDYSGRVLNLASRLMDIARPSGIVFDADFGIDLLSDEQAERFAKESVYIKGIAERESIDVWYSKDLTEISATNKQPLAHIQWRVDKYQWTLKKVKQSSGYFSYELKSTPTDSSQVSVKITHPSVRKGRRQKAFLSFFKFTNFEYVLEAGSPRIKIDFDVLAKRLEAASVKEPWPITLEVIYPKRPDRSKIKSR